MTASPPQHISWPATDQSHKPAIQEFLQWCNEASVISAESQDSFVPLSSLQTYFGERRGFRLKNILRDLISESDPHTVDSIFSGYLRNFSILLTIGKGTFIINFLQHEELRDVNSPFKSREPPDTFPATLGRTEFYAQFQEQQWRFYPHEFHRFIHDEHINSKRILPFRSKKEISSGGSASIHRVELEGCYNQLGASSAAKPSTVVIKTFFTDDADEYYHRECRTFQKLWQMDDVITYYGSYRYRDTFNLILEWANGGSLADYLRRETPPKDGYDILTFWRNFLRIVNGLEKLHNAFAGTLTRPGTTEGWHQDVTPGNVLIVKPRNSRPYGHLFKISDLGLAHFKKGESEADIFDNDSQGTKTYGAPETYKWDISLEESLQITNSVDIWSICCIISEVAVWVVRGCSGMDDYSSARKQETSHIPGFSGGDCFHDGSRVLRCVHTIHHECKDEIRLKDVVTPKIIDLVDGILRLEAADRPKARGLCSSIRAIIDEAQGVLSQGEDLEQYRYQRRLNKAELPPSETRRHSGRPLSQSSIGYYPSSSKTLPPELPPGLPVQLPGRSRTLNELSTSPPGGSPSPISSVAGPVPYGHSHPYALFNHPFSIPEEDVNGGARKFSNHPRSPGEAAIASRGFNIINTTSIESEKGSQNDGKSPQAESTTSPVKTLLKNPLPHLAVNDAERWMERRKNKGINRARKLVKKLANPGSADSDLPNAHLLSRLWKRDHVFVLDDSDSMAEEWETVAKRFLLLAYMVKETDDDGLEVIFANSPHEKLGGWKTSKLRQKIEKKKPHGSTSNLKSCLEDILGTYGRLLHTNRKKLSLYVFTNGLWHGGGEACGMERPIEQLTMVLENKNSASNQVAIQFIGFGWDQEGMKRLNYLDKLNRHKGLARDIVDTTHCDGNVWKMLLGATDSQADDDSDTEVGVSNGHLSSSQMYSSDAYQQPSQAMRASNQFFDKPMALSPRNTGNFN